MAILYAIYDKDMVITQKIMQHALRNQEQKTEQFVGL